MAVQHSEYRAGLPCHETTVCHDARQKYQPHGVRSSARLALISRAASWSSRPARACQAAIAAERRAEDGDRPDDAVLAEDRRRHRDATRRSARLRSMASPVMTIPPRPARSSASVGVPAVIRSRSWARTSSRTSVGANASRTRPGAPAYSGDIVARLQRHPERLVGLDLVEADARQADPPDDDRGLAGLVDEHPQGRVGVADEALGC